MKKLIYTTTFILSISMGLIMGDRSANAQVSVGGRVGIDIGSVSYSPSLPSGYTSATHTGFLLGGQIDSWFSDMWAISVQLLYNQKGSEITVASGEGNGLTSTTDGVSSYLELPILVKFAIGDGNLRPYLFAGPSFGLLLSSTQTNGGVSIDVDSNYNKLDISALIGIGAALRLGEGGPSLILDVGDAIGLANIVRNGSTVTGSSQDVSQSVKTNDIRIAAGILFPI